MIDLRRLQRLRDDSSISDRDYINTCATLSVNHQRLPGYPTQAFADKYKRPHNPLLPGMIDGVTWCNQYVYDILAYYNCDTTDLYNPEYTKANARWYTTANMFGIRLRNTRKPLSTDEATGEYVSENRSIIVVSYIPYPISGRPLRHGHLAILLPRSNANCLKEKLVCQAGTVNGILPIGIAFPGSTMMTTEFYEVGKYAK